MATTWNAEGVDFGNFYPVQANYGPRDIHAVAALVTRNNIGQWSLEFEAELLEVAGDVYFFVYAVREGEDPIQLKIVPEVWIVKIWGELHVFKDGTFQNTFDVPKDQMKAVRKAHREKDIELEREWRKEQEEVRSALQADFETKVQRAMDSGDWSELDIAERHDLMRRLKEDETFKVYEVAARLMMESKKQALEKDTAKDAVLTGHLHIPIGDLVEEIKNSGVQPVRNDGYLYETTIVPEGQSLTGDTVEALSKEQIENRLKDSVDLEETRIVPAIGELPENPHNTQGIDTP